MSSGDLTALLDAIQNDEQLRARLQAATDLNAAEAIAQEAGFNVSKAEWLSYQNQTPQELEDSELEDVAGGFFKKPKGASIDGKNIEFKMSEGSFNCGGGAA